MTPIDKQFKHILRCSMDRIAKERRGNMRLYRKAVESEQKRLLARGLTIMEGEIANPNSYRAKSAQWITQPTTPVYNDFHDGCLMLVDILEDIFEGMMSYNRQHPEVVDSVLFIELHSLYNKYVTKEAKPGKGEKLVFTKDGKKVVKEGINKQEKLITQQVRYLQDMLLERIAECDTNQYIVDFVIKRLNDDSLTVTGYLEDKFPYMREERLKQEKEKKEKEKG